MDAVPYFTQELTRNSVPIRSVRGYLAMINLAGFMQANIVLFPKRVRTE